MLWKGKELFNSPKPGDIQFMRQRHWLSKSYRSVCRQFDRLVVLCHHNVFWKCFGEEKSLSQPKEEACAFSEMTSVSVAWCFYDASINHIRTTTAANDWFDYDPINKVCFVKQTVQRYSGDHMRQRWLTDLINLTSRQSTNCFSRNQNATNLITF